MNASKSAQGLLSRELSRKTVFYLLLGCLVLLLIPMLLIARCAVPTADDYVYGLDAARAFSEEGTFFAALSAAVKLTANTYMTWQGTYSAAVLMSLQPAAFGEQFYPLTAYIMLTALLSGIFFFCFTLFRRLFGGDRYSAGIVAAAAAILCTQFVPVPAESFYWFNGSLFYTFFFGVSLIAYSLIIRYVLAEKRSVASAVGVSLLLIFIGGGNYVTALFSAELLGAALILLAIRKNGRWKDMLLFFVIFLAAFLANALAPGNAVRQAAYAERFGLAETILKCFITAAQALLGWFTMPVLVVLIFLVPVFGAICLRTEYRFRYPLLVSLFSFCLLSSMYCPTIFAMGPVGLTPVGRVRDIIFYTFILMAAFNVFYWTGWALRRYEKLRREPAGIKLWFILATLLLTLGGTVFMSLRQNVTSVHAVVQLYNGAARSYYETAQQRLAVLKDDSIKDVEFAPFEKIPYVIFYSDITEDAGDWRNLDMMYYYNKDSVRLTESYGDYSN